MTSAQPRPFLALALLAGGASTQFVFEPATTVDAVPGELAYAVGALHIADLDGDGWLDLVRSDGQLGTLELAVFLGTGGGQFAPGPQPPLPGHRVRAVGDLDGDGWPDLVTSTFGPGLLLMRGLGDGGFAPPQPLAGVDGLEVRIADLDGDGHADLLCDPIPLATAEHRAFLGHGDGTFTQGWSASTFFIEGAAGALADLDGDGVLDYAKTWVFRDLQIWFGLDGSTTQSHHTYEIGDETLLSVEAGDVDEDGDPDLLVAARTGVTILRNDGGASFPVHAVLTPGADVLDMTTADLDRDGLLDIVLADAAGSLQLLRGHGDGTFGPPVSIQAPAALELHVADLDRAGFEDLALIARPPLDPAQHTTLNELRVLRNHTYKADAPFTDLGHALAGSAGWPVLLAGGDLLPGGSWRLDLAGAAPGALAHCILGHAQAAEPFHGGVLVPQADLVLASEPVGADGRISLGGHWTGAPSGTQLWAQWWIEDASGVQGWTATSGVAIVVP